MDSANLDVPNCSMMRLEFSGEANATIGTRAANIRSIIMPPRTSPKQNPPNPSKNPIAPPRYFLDIRMVMMPQNSFAARTMSRKAIMPIRRSVILSATQCPIVSAMESMGFFRKDR